MTFWAKFGILIASYALVALAGWHVRVLYDGAAQAKYDQAIIEKQQAIEKLTAQISASYEAGKQSTLNSHLSSTLTLSKPNATYSACRVLPNDIRLLKASVSTANASK